MNSRRDGLQCYFCKIKNALDLKFPADRPARSNWLAQDAITATRLSLLHYNSLGLR